MTQFAGAAEGYDRYMGRYTPGLAVALADAAGLLPGMRALDVGCGPGGLTRELVSRLGPDRVAAIDPAPQFVAAAGTAILVSTSASAWPSSCRGRTTPSMPRSARW